MTAKILKHNGNVANCSTYHALTLEKMSSPVKKKAHDVFDAAIMSKLGDGAKAADYEDLGKDFGEEFETPQHKKYCDDSKDTPPPVPEANKVTPKALDNYVGARVMLPRGDGFDPGRVKSRKQDADGNVAGKVKSNLIRGDSVIP